MNNHVLGKPREKETKQYEVIMINDLPIRIGIKEHLNRMEAQAHSEKKLQYSWFKFPLSYFVRHDNRTRHEKTYSYLLAFYRRIDLPLDLALSAMISYDSFPIYEISNFIVFNELFEKYYESFQKVDTENSRKRATFKKQTTQIILKFWLSGYGIFPNYTDNYIDTEQLEYIKNWKGSHRTKVSRFLGYVLSNEEASPINTIPKIKNNTTLKDRESSKWNNLILRYNTPISKELFDFTFLHLRKRINSTYVLEYTDNEGSLLRESLNSITEGTWVQYSVALLDLATMLNQSEYFSIDDCLNKGIEEIMTSEVSQLSKNRKQNIRITCKTWIKWYTQVNHIHININRIIPMSLRNRDKTFARMLNYGAVQTLIDVLLDDNSGYFNENNISDFRARRACLLQLATGQRASEICCLLYNCLHKDNMGVTWLFIHKTKAGGSNKVLATVDIIKWIEELQKVSPKSKILISTSEYPYGDDLNEYRLFANMFDEGPLTSDSMNKFLINIQQKIWGDSHPNKKYFSTHDLRKIQALYMRLIGKSKDEIQDQLGHNNINSQLPYLSTKPLEHQNWFKRIQLEGVYQNITSMESSDTLELGKVINKSIQLSDNKFSKERVIDVLLKVSTDTENFEIPKYNNSPLPTGFPLRYHSCNATSLVNCGHTELHCFGCDYYRPDSDTLEDHKVEIFRYMLLILYQERLGKGTKDLLEHEILQVRTSDILDLVDRAIIQVFKNFNLTATEIIKLKTELYNSATNYLKKHLKSNPCPNFTEAKEYLLGGSL